MGKQCTFHKIEKGKFFLSTNHKGMNCK